MGQRGRRGVERARAISIVIFADEIDAASLI
jgi:hypothetical protein